MAPIKPHAPMTGGLLPKNGSLADARNTQTARSLDNRYPSSAPGTKPLDQIITRATSGIDSSPGTLIDESRGLTGPKPIIGKGQLTTAMKEFQTKSPITSALSKKLADQSQAAAIRDIQNRK
jgi:hypothetical protein